MFGFRLFDLASVLLEETDVHRLRQIRHEEAPEGGSRCHESTASLLLGE